MISVEAAETRKNIKLFSTCLLHAQYYVWEVRVIALLEALIVTDETEEILLWYYSGHNLAEESLNAQDIGMDSYY